MEEWRLKRNVSACEKDEKEEWKAFVLKEIKKKVKKDKRKKMEKNNWRKCGRKMSITSRLAWERKTRDVYTYEFISFLSLFSFSRGIVRAPYFYLPIRTPLRSPSCLSVICLGSLKDHPCITVNRRQKIIFFSDTIQESVFFFTKSRNSLHKLSCLILYPCSFLLAILVNTD